MIQICVNRQNILFQRNFEYHKFWKYMLFRASFSDLLRSRRKIKNSIPVFLRSSPCLYPQGLKTGLIRLKHQPCPHPIRNHHIVLFLCYNLQQQQKKKVRAIPRPQLCYVEPDYSIVTSIITTRILPGLKAKNPFDMCQ